MVEGRPPAQPDRRRALPWLNLLLTILLIIGGLAFLSSRVDLAAVGRVLAGTEPVPVALALAIMVLTIGLKAWRWLLLFPSAGGPRYAAAFWAISLGQYVNLVVPFLRLGEVARIYVLNRESAAAPAQTLGTLVVEKALDLLFFALAILLVLPLVAIPGYSGQGGPLVILAPLLLVVVLYLLAFHTEWVIDLTRRLAQPLPDRLEAWVIRIGVSGLEGLAALRDRRRMLGLLLQSLIIAALGVVLPWLLFPALGLSLTWLDAALVHIVVTIAITPPSTPVKIGVFNGAAAFVLWSRGVADETALVSYSILLYLVVVGPQLLLGLVAALRSNWQFGNAGPTGPLVDRSPTP